MNGLTEISVFGTMIGANAESRIRRGDKIDMKQPGLDLSQRHASSGRAVDGEKHFITARRRRSASAKVRGNQAVGITQAGWGDKKANCVGGVAG